MVLDFGRLKMKTEEAGHLDDNDHPSNKDQYGGEDSGDEENESDFHTPGEDEDQIPDIFGREATHVRSLRLR